MERLAVIPYDENWKHEYERIKAELLCAIDGCILAIEHVGSTSVEGLAAKPIIDIDIVVKDYHVFEDVKARLTQIGYTYEGDLGIKDRHAFKYVDKAHVMKHHLYVCPEYSEELQRHIVFRDYLRTHPKDRARYGEVKTLAAMRYSEDRDGYMAAKNACVVEILQKSLVWQRNA